MYVSKINVSKRLLVYGITSRKHQVSGLLAAEADLESKSVVVIAPKTLEDL